MSTANRRDVLRSAAAAGTMAWLGASTAAGQGFRGRIKKAVKYHMIQEDLPVLEKLKLLRDLGFDGVEVRSGEPIDRNEMRQASQATGIPIHGVINSSHPDIASAIELARFYEAGSVLVVVPVDKDGSYLQNYQTRQDIIRRAIPMAERLDIQILIENVWASFLIEPLGMARFVDELNSPQVGVYFDVGNNVRWGYPEHWIEVLGERIKKLDIKEYSRDLQNDEGLRAGFNVEIGEGSVDWVKVRRELENIDFRGWATAEVRGGDRRRLAEIAERMDKVLLLS